MGCLSTLTSALSLFLLIFPFPLHPLRAHILARQLPKIRCDRLDALVDVVGFQLAGLPSRQLQQLAKKERVTHPKKKTKKKRP